ncbi:MAG: hypothetical protein JO142_07900 [Burkholderiales bacterium]|nr:hypothetical protein [Burkholderiales bacterium]
MCKHVDGRRLVRSAALAGLSALIAGCAAHPNERVTGDGGSALLRVSSRQVTVDLTDAERDALSHIQDHTLGNIGGKQALTATVATLGKMGFDPVKADQEMSLVEGERNRIVGERWRAAIRALLKAKGLPLRGKPDHESIHALISVRPDQTGPGTTLVRARFDVTVWDTNGDSRTTTLQQEAVYQCFFAGLDRALSGQTVDGDLACLNGNG